MKRMKMIKGKLTHWSKGKTAKGDLKNVITIDNKEGSSNYHDFTPGMWDSDFKQLLSKQVKVYYDEKEHYNLFKGITTPDVDLPLEVMA